MGNVSSELASADSVELLRQCVSACLAKDLAAGQVDVPPFDPEGLRQAARHHRVESFLDSHSDLLGFDPETREYFRSEARAQHIAGLGLVSSTLSVCELFARHGFDFLVFKGVALAVTSGRSPSSRGAGDIDILIRAHDIPRAHKMLLAEGFRPKIAFAPEEKALWKFWAFRERELSYRKEAVAIDLHWRIPKNMQHLPSAKTLLKRKSHLLIAGQLIPTLTASDSLAACAIHIYLDYCQNLRLLTDLVFLSHQEGVHIPSDVPQAGRQLISDVLEFSRQLFDYHLVVDVPGALPPKAKNVDYLMRMWKQNSSAGLLHARSPSATGEAEGRLRHWTRYGGSVREVVRFISWAFFAFPDYTDMRPSTSLPRSLAFRLRQVFTGSLPYVKARKDQL